MPDFGLIGFPLTHSFSKDYFNAKFESEKLHGFSYELFPLASLSELAALIESHPELKGLNVTIPYKTEILSYLDSTDEVASKAGAVNTLVIKREGGKTTLSGFNTDVYGFRKSLLDFTGNTVSRCLILGTGGASKAAAYVLTGLAIPYLFVSRNPKSELEISYKDLNESIIEKHKLIINTTPAGMHPGIDTFPPIPYNSLTPTHFLFDMVYNPAETKFLLKGKERGCHIQNGLQMLHFQADDAFRIWMQSF